MKRSNAIDVDPLKAAQAKMQADVARARRKLRGVGDLALDRETAAHELSEEQRALRDSRPTNRRWRALDKLDRHVDRMQQRLLEAGARLQEAEAALARAPEDDAHDLADWLAGGERGQRPAASLYERLRDRDAARLLAAAATVEVDRALERRLAHIASNRSKMLEDARRDVVEARERLQAQADALPALRQALLDARSTLMWAATFPDRAESFGIPNAVALGLRGPVEASLGTKAMISYSALLDVLAADATTLAETFSTEQAERLGGVDPDPTREAMWSTDPAFKTWAKGELDRARGLAEYGDALALAAEANDYRPDP